MPDQELPDGWLPPGSEALGSIKTIHLRKQLVQCLLTLIIAAAITAESRLLPIASISSIKMIHGAFFFASLNRSRTRDAPTPTNISTNPNLKVRRTAPVPHLQLPLQAVSYLFPEVLQAKCSLSEASLRCCVFLRIMQKIHNSCSDSFGFILSCHILECNSGVSFSHNLGLALANAHHAAAFIHTAHERTSDHKKKQCRQNTLSSYSIKLPCIRLSSFSNLFPSFQPWSVHRASSICRVI